MNKTRVTGLFVLVVLMMGLGTAAAIDAPKWVAILYVEAQKAVGMRWLPAPGATEYQVLRSETEGSGHEKIATVKQPQHFDSDIEAGTTYKVAGWAPVAEGVQGDPVWDVVAGWLRDRKTVPLKKPDQPRLIGLSDNLGLSSS